MRMQMPEPAERTREAELDPCVCFPCRSQRNSEVVVFDLKLAQPPVGAIVTLAVARLGQSRIAQQMAASDLHRLAALSQALDTVFPHGVEHAVADGAVDLG